MSSVIRKHPEIFLTFGYLFLLLASVVLSSVFLLRRMPDSTQDEVKELVPITSTQPISQTIIPNYNGLDTVYVFLKNPGVLNIDPFNFSLTGESGEKLVDIKINGRNIGDGETVKFQFPPLVSSAHQKLTLTLSAPETLVADTAVKVGISSADNYPSGQIGGRFGPRDISFQLFYRPQNRPALYRQLISSFFSRLLSTGFQKTL